MAEIICKGCGASDYVKNGYVRGLQRYRCKECGCNFTATAPRGKPAAMKALAVLLYAMANVSFCSTARLLKVSDVAVLKWVRAEARKLPEPEPSGHIAIVTLDEMWHFLLSRAVGWSIPLSLILSPGSFFCPGSALGRHLMGLDKEQVGQSKNAQWQGPAKMSSA
jgi:transposase